MGNIYGSSKVCFQGDKLEMLNEDVSNVTREGRDFEFEETFPSWNIESQGIEDTEIGSRKVMLKSLPSGSFGYELDKATAYANLDTINISKCLPLSPDLGKIMAKSDNPELRAYVWQVWTIILKPYNVLPLTYFVIKYTIVLYTLFS